jgi:site-specific recombinase XerC
VMCEAAPSTALTSLSWAANEAKSAISFQYADPAVHLAVTRSIWQSYANRVQQSPMEFIEAPAFTRHLPKYLDDDQYKLYRQSWRRIPSSEM